MKTMETYIALFLDEAIRYGISKIVYTLSVEDSYLIKQAKQKQFELFAFEDARSVGYIGTGMCAESKETVIVCTNGDNEYRSFMSAMTEAYYRNLPLISVTIAGRILLDTDVEFKDISYKSVAVSYKDTENDARNKINTIITNGKAVHICFNMMRDNEYVEHALCSEQLENHTMIKHDLLFENLEKYVDSNGTLFIDSNVACPQNLSKEVRYICDGAFGFEGRLAYTLGASLAQKKKKYIAVVSEKSAIHDINTLGNREMNNRVVYIVIIDNKANILRECARNLGFEIRSLDDIHEVMQDTISPVLYLI